MALTSTDSYLQSVYGDVCKRSAYEPEFLQAAGEVLEFLRPVVEQNQRLAKLGVIDRVAELEHSLLFRISWVDDHGQIQVSRGYWVQSSTTIGPSKDDLRFRPSINLPIIRFLSFEQMFKNFPTGLPMGGGKGGANLDPRDKSGSEIMRFYQSFMTELQCHIGPDIDMPTGDIGAGTCEIGYLFGQYKHVCNEFNGVPTGKSPSYDGSLARTEAIGYGLCYFADEMLKTAGKSFQGQNMMISGSGNMAIYANQKATELGGKVIAVSDSNGYIVNENGINYEAIQEVEEAKHACIKTYLDYVPTAKYLEDCQGTWTVPCSIILPCATQNELPLEGVKALVEHGRFTMTEGVNMPSTPEAMARFQEHSVPFTSAKASSAGGVVIPSLEMSQDSMRPSWSFEEVGQKLRIIARNICHSATNAVVGYGMEGNLVAGANTTDFMKVASTTI